MAFIPPKIVTASEVKQKLLKPSLTSNYVTTFTITQEVSDWLKKRDGNFNFLNQQDLINLSCSDAFIPGSSFMTNEVTDDFHGVNERLPYRRLYDNQASFTFYIDAPKTNPRQPGYNVLWFFEQWQAYIVGEEYNTDTRGGLYAKNYFYRARFPDNYRSDFYIVKFERDFDLNHASRIPSEGNPKPYGYQNKNECANNYVLSYRFLDGYPLQVSSMPVSYQGSEILKTTVSFAYSRYIVRRGIIGNIVDGDRSVDNGVSGIFTEQDRGSLLNTAFNPNPLAANDIPFSVPDAATSGSLF